MVWGYCVQTLYSLYVAQYPNGNAQAQVQHGARLCDLERQLYGRAQCELTVCAVCAHCAMAGRSYAYTGAAAFEHTPRLGDWFDLYIFRLLVWCCAVCCGRDCLDLVQYDIICVFTRTSISLECFFGVYEYV